MTNEEKAIDIAENISPYDIGGDNDAHYAAKEAALSMAEWKDYQLGWHDAKKEQPPMDEEVIVLTSVLMDAKNLDAPRKICFGHIVDKEICVDYDGWNIPRVVYWMYFPKLK